jgi:hypothetical protein
MELDSVHVYIHGDDSALSSTASAPNSPESAPRAPPAFFVLFLFRVETSNDEVSMAP